MNNEWLKKEWSELLAPVEGKKVELGEESEDLMEDLIEDEFFVSADMSSPNQTLPLAMQYDNDCTCEKFLIDISSSSSLPTESAVQNISGQGIVPNPGDIFVPGAGQHFLKNLLKCSDEQILKHLHKAEKFFAGKFGINFSRIPFRGQTKRTEKAELFAFQLNPKLDTHVVSVDQCKKVFSGGWAVRVLRDFDSAKAGSFLFYGTHMIVPFSLQKEIAKVVADQIDHVDFRSSTPFLCSEHGVASIDNDVRCGGKVGSSRGLMKIVLEEEKNWRVSISETWTF